MKFAIHTLGCKVNTYESDLIVRQMKEAGFDEVPFGEKADVIIVNTCTVTNIADRKSRQMLHRARTAAPEAMIVAAGCYSDAVSQGKGLPEAGVDLWVLNREKQSIARRILDKLASAREPADISASAVQSSAEMSSAQPSLTSSAVALEPPVNSSAGSVWQSGSFLTELNGHTRAFIKIQDGCNQFCSYCIIPYVRGRVTARPVEDTLNEACELAKRGITEIVLTGINLTSLGEDLLKTIDGLEKIDGIRRVRLGSLEPRLITEEFIGQISSAKKLCHHFHLSLQSGCNKTLKNMNRHYTADEYAAGCDLLRRTWPDAAITTDIIVGFPGETEEDFEETLSFVKRIGFYEAHVFKYSRRKGTVADRMDGQLTEAVKTARSARLISLCDGCSHDFRTRFLGREVTFLYEETIVHDGEKYLTGFTPEYIRCLLPLSASAAFAAEPAPLADTLPEPASLASASPVLTSAPVPGVLITAAAAGLVPVKNLGECLLLK